MSPSSLASSPSTFSKNKWRTKVHTALPAAWGHVTAEACCPTEREGAGDHRVPGGHSDAIHMPPGSRHRALNMKPEPREYMQL